MSDAVSQSGLEGVHRGLWKLDPSAPVPSKAVESPVSVSLLVDHFSVSGWSCSLHSSPFWVSLHVSGRRTSQPLSGPLPTVRSVLTAAWSPGSWEAGGKPQSPCRKCLLPVLMFLEFCRSGEDRCLWLIVRCLFILIIFFVYLLAVCLFVLLLPDVRYMGTDSFSNENFVFSFSFI